MKKLAMAMMLGVAALSANAQVNYRMQTACNPQDVKTYDTQRLRSSFMMEKVLVADEINVTYSMYDRFIFGGAMPVNKELSLDTIDPLKAPYFLFNRELGVINIGGDGIVTVDGKEYELKFKDVSNEYRYLFYNNKVSEFYKEAFDCMLGKNDFEVNDLKASLFREEDNRVLQSDKPISFNRVLFDEETGLPVRWAVTTKTRLEDKEGNLYIVATMVDTTDIRRNELELDDIRRAKVFNIKQMAAALAYIQDNNLTDYEQLAKKATEAADRFHVISEQVKQTEQAMKTNAGLKAATVQYAKTRPVFEQYKATKYSRKFLAEHEADLELYRAAQAEMRSLLRGAKLPKMDVLKEEGRKLTAKKKQLYGEYQKARRDMQEIVTIKANIDTLMGYTEPGRKQEKER